MLLPLLLISLSVLRGAATAQIAASTPMIDSDGDGISDEQEQVLLERFRPTFMVSRTDCAIRPARFEPNHTDPKVLVADGTIYGQVFPAPGNRVEIHYYTLWDKDCGRMKHPLDAEHVSVLISLEPEEVPKELYWYAGAHEKTSCEMSSGGRADAGLLHDDHPAVWSSAGKHALYFQKEMCGHGCGADLCKDNIELPNAGAVINIGELNRPMNGSSWVKSSAWPLSDKMDTDFTRDVIVQLDAAPVGTMLILRGNRAMRGTIGGADAALDGGAIGAQHTGAALDTANGDTSNSLDAAAKATRRALNRAWQAVFPPSTEESTSH